MARKTISIDMEAYRRLVEARRTPRESFSQVIQRAVWPDSGKTGGAFLKVLSETEPLSEEEIEFLEAAQLGDQPPEDPWRNA